VGNEDIRDERGAYDRTQGKPHQGKGKRGTSFGRSEGKWRLYRQQGFRLPANPQEFPDQERLCPRAQRVEKKKRGRNDFRGFKLAKSPLPVPGRGKRFPVGKRSKRTMSGKKAGIGSSSEKRKVTGNPKVEGWEGKKRGERTQSEGRGKRNEQGTRSSRSGDCALPRGMNQAEEEIR